MTSDAHPGLLSNRLGYLLKHAHLRYTDASARALAPLGVDGRELAVLVVLAADTPLSQLEAAGRLGVDRTTMVALIDGLEAKRLAQRVRSPADRRKNIVRLTSEGGQLLRRAERVRQDTEQRFLADLPDADADALLRALRTLAAPPDRRRPEATATSPAGGTATAPAARAGAAPLDRADAGR